MFEKVTTKALEENFFGETDTRSVN